jgi:peptide/nickel transport system substrate-binding protein
MKRPIIALIISLVFTLVLSSCGMSSSTTIPLTPSSPTSSANNPSAPAKASTSVPPTITSSQAAKYGGSLRFITNAPGAAIGFPAEGTGESNITTNFCTDFLLRGDEKGNLTPALATSYDIDPGSNNSSIIFHLRKGVKFQDGSDFNAQALNWNLETLKKNPRTANNMSYMNSFEIIDDYTLKINMTAWQNRFVTSFANTPLQIISPTAYQKNGLEWVIRNVVGTGPFIQTDYQSQVAFKAKRNDNYWDTGKPYLDGVQLSYVVDQLTSKALFLSGDADVLHVGANYTTASELQKSGYQIAQLMTGGSILMPDSMNDDSPWSNPKVRMAAEYAIDKESIVKALGYGFLTASYQVPSPASLAYDPALPGRKYNVAKAKQLLAEAGYPIGFKTTLLWPIIANRDVGVAVQDYLASVNIQADLQITEAARTAQIQSGTWHNALVFGTPAEAPNFSISLNIFFKPTPGIGMWMSVKKPDGYREAYNAALTSKEQDPALLKKCIDLFYNDATVIPLFNASSLWAMGKNIQDAGFGKRISLTQSNPQDAWFKK